MNKATISYINDREYNNHNVYLICNNYNDWYEIYKMIANRYNEDVEEAGCPEEREDYYLDTIALSKDWASKADFMSVVKECVKKWKQSKK